MTHGVNGEVLHLTGLWGYIRQKKVVNHSTCKAWASAAALLHWRAAVLPQHGLFTFLSHPQEHCNACSSTSLQPQSRAPMNCQAWFSKLWLKSPCSLTKRAVKTVVLVVISQVRAITTDISILDRQLQPDTNYSTQKAPLQVRVIVLK